MAELLGNIAPSDPDVAQTDFAFDISDALLFALLVVIVVLGVATLREVYAPGVPLDTSFRLATLVVLWGATAVAVLAIFAVVGRGILRIIRRRKNGAQ